MIRTRQIAILGVLILALSYSTHAMAKAEKGKPKIDDEDIPVIDTSVDPATLPEQYEAEVLIEGKFTDDGKPGTFHPGDVNQVVEFDVSVDREGNVYILDPLNDRIQVFNSKGEYSRSIPIKDGWVGGEWRREEGKVKAVYYPGKKKTQIAIDDEGYIYLLDSGAGELLKLDLQGREVNRSKVDGKIINLKIHRKTKKKVYIVEENASGNIRVKVGEGKFRIKGRRKTGFPVPSEDEYGNVYVRMSVEGDDGIVRSGMFKISKKHRILAIVDTHTYWSGEKNKNCGPLMATAYESELVDSAGNIYFCQNCGQKLRVIRLQKKSSKE